MTYGVDERDQLVGRFDHCGAVGLPVGIVGPDRLALFEPVDGVREVGREPAFDLVGLDIQKAPRTALAVVRLAGDERPDEGALAVIDVARGADDDVTVVLYERALADCGDADESLLDPPRVDRLDVGVGLLGEQREHVHRLRELLGGDPREPAVVGDTNYIGGLAVAREHPMAELGREAL